MYDPKHRIITGVLADMLLRKEHCLNFILFFSVSQTNNMYVIYNMYMVGICKCCLKPSYD